MITVVVVVVVVVEVVVVDDSCFCVVLQLLSRNEKSKFTDIISFPQNTKKTKHSS